jgi:hypothetical protein
MYVRYPYLRPNQSLEHPLTQVRPISSYYREIAHSLVAMSFPRPTNLQTGKYSYNYYSLRHHIYDIYSIEEPLLPFQLIGTLDASYDS